MKVSYRLRDGFSINAPVDEVGARIDELKRRHATPSEPDGSCTIEEIIADARDPSSPLHPCFIWDDAEAAEEYRRERAKYLQRCYEVRIERVDREPIVLSPANVIVKSPDRGRVVVSASAAMSREDYRGQVLRETSALLVGVQKRLRNLQGISPEVVRAIEAAIKAVENEAGVRLKVGRKVAHAEVTTSA